MPTRHAPLSVFDNRPFFEKALVFGVRNGIIDQRRLDEISNDAPRGMVQIARYFGSEFLRPELERARDRLVNLVSLQLEVASGGDLRQAAESLRDASFLSRSKGGSDMLKALIAMPQNSHFGMHEGGAFTDAQIPQLAKWSLRSLAEYQAEFAKRNAVAQVIDAAVWLAGQWHMDARALEDAGKDAEAVIRTALLMAAAGRTGIPDWVTFEKTVAALRKKPGTTSTKPDVVQSSGVIAGLGRKPSKPGQGSHDKRDSIEKTSRVVVNPDATNPRVAIPMPGDLPARFGAVVEAARQSVISDLPRILDTAISARKLFDQTPAFMGRYFWIEDGLGEVDQYDRAMSAAWSKATGGHGDDGSLLTLFLCLAAGATPKTVLGEKEATRLVRKIRKTGFRPELALQFIDNHAPEQHHDDYARLWSDFVDEAQATLCSDFDPALHDALALLRLTCNLKQGV